MSGFATAISLKSHLKKGVSTDILRFFSRFTALPDLQIYFQTHVILTYDISSLPVLYFSSDVILPHPYCGGAASIEVIAFADEVEIYSKEIYLKDSGIHIEFDIPPNTEILDLL